jgi:hypothetical protein
VQARVAVSSENWTMKGCAQMLVLETDCYAILAIVRALIAARSPMYIYVPPRTLLYIVLSSFVLSIVY